MGFHSQSLSMFAWFSLLICVGCAVWIVFDQWRHPQKMWIMNLVWPITALYLGPFAVWMYRTTRSLMKKDRNPNAQPSKVAQTSTVSRRTQISVATFHCGAGCTLGDIIAETTVPIFGLAFAGEFGTKLLADFMLAYLLGIAFQYFTIVPMRNLGFYAGVKAALRADTISIALFEVGMFGWMALSYFVLFPSPHLKPSDPVFWFMMQLAMIAGFLTSYPANRWLIAKGWKEKMPENENFPLEVTQTRAA